MSLGRKPLYVPALRMKTGELQGLQQLAEDVKAPTLPHMIVPPLAERDDEVRRLLGDVEKVPHAGTILAKYWRRRCVLLDLRYLFDEFGESRCGSWLPKTFELARGRDVLAAPVASLADLTGTRAQAFRDAVYTRDALLLAIRVASGDLAEPGIRDQLCRALEAIGVVPERAVVLADFTDADFSQPDLVTGVIEGTLELLEEVGRWQAIVFQGTSYPEVNPAENGGDIVVPRNEWKAWSKAVQFGKATEEHLVFGDYAADCAKMNFGKSGGRPICHYRYTTSTDWLVVRGAETGADATVMREVSRRIVGSRYFAGESFSRADNYIYGTAQGIEGPGNATKWREINTTHHITRVIRDIGKVKGLTFGELKVAPARQLHMFE